MFFQMDEKTNKGKLEILKFLRSAMKTVKNPMIFVKNAKKKKKNRKMISFGNFC